MANPGIFQRLLDHMNTTAAHGSVVTSRKLNTTAPLTGGGDLTVDRTLGVSSATETARGVVELATATETAAGTDSTKAVHPAGLRAAINSAMTGASGDASLTIFDTSGTFTAPDDGTAFVTVVGGGQAGGRGTAFNSIPGGAAGEVLHTVFEMAAGGKATVVVGAGGSGGAGAGTTGGNSSFGSILAYGGNIAEAVPRRNAEQARYGKNGKGGASKEIDTSGGEGGYLYPLLALGRNVKAFDGGDPGWAEGGYGYGAGGGGTNGSDPGSGYRGIVIVTFIKHP